MILLPIGHEEAAVRRLPWITFGLMVACFAIFAASGQARLVSPHDARLYRAAAEAVEYHRAHPHLRLDAAFERALGPGPPTPLHVAELSGSPPRTRAARPLEQAQLDARVERALAFYETHPLRRFGLVPRRAGSFTLVSYMFLHAGWLHLLSNLLVLFLAGPFIEDVWGRPLYLGFYLAAGLAAALAHLGVESDSAVPLVGASGAIAGVMGAFLLRYGRTRIRFFYMVGLFLRGTFAAPSWVMIPLWFVIQLGFTMFAPGGGGGVAHAAHVGGFVFGALFGVVMHTLQVEERLIGPGIARKIDARGPGRGQISHPHIRM